MLLVDLPSCSLIYLTLKTKAILPMMKNTKKKKKKQQQQPKRLFRASYFGRFHATRRRFVKKIKTNEGMKKKWSVFIFS